MADWESEKPAGVAGVVRVERTHDRVKAGYGPVSSHAYTKSPLFPVGAEGRVVWDTENVSRVAPGAACRVSGEYVVFCVLYIRRHSVLYAGSQGRQETASLYAGGIRAVIAVAVTADCVHCT